MQTSAQLGRASRAIMQERPDGESVPLGRGRQRGAGATLRDSLARSLTDALAFLEFGVPLKFGGFGVRAARAGPRNTWIRGHT